MPAAPSWTIRSLLPDDLNDLLDLQAQCFGEDFLESAEVYARRLASDHQQSLGIACERTRALRAYAAAYWSDPGKVTPFDGDFLPPRAHQPVLYLHDVSVAPEWSGRGAAGALLGALFQRARARRAPGRAGLGAGFASLLGAPRLHAAGRHGPAAAAPPAQLRRGRGLHGCAALRPQRPAAFIQPGIPSGRV